MWAHQHHRIVFAVGFLLLAELSYQLIFPYDTALPFSRAMGQSVAYEKSDKLAARFQDMFAHSSVALTNGSHTVTIDLPNTGAVLNADVMTSELTTYPLWQRLVPFSIAWYQPQVNHLSVLVSGQQLAVATDDIANELSYAPTDADLELKKGNLTVTEAKEGRSVTESAVRDTLIQATYENGVTTLTVPATVKNPTRSDADVEEAVMQAKRVLSAPITITIEGVGEVSPDTAARAEWMSVDLTKKPAELNINLDAITDYVTGVSDKVKVNPTATVVKVVDGEETGRTNGSAGKQLNITTISKTIRSALVSGEDPGLLQASFVPIASPVVYNRTYTHSLKGLRAYVDYATSTQNVRIVVQQLDSPGWSASGRAEESIPSASTYKLYVMMRVFDDINSGKLKWDTPMLDTTAGGCFERTIVPSLNACAEEWIRQYGRDNLNSYVHAKGFSNGTGFTFSDATHTTAGDLAKYLVGLYNGTLVSGSNRDMLLEKMGRQLYRYGIPTGTKGWTQDKVGFLWDYIHDAGIVHNPKGTYVLVIMTKGYSYGYIANVAKQIDTILYP